MDAYIDLSILVFLINYGLSIIYSKIIINQINKCILFIVQTLLLSVLVSLINIFFIPYFFIFFMVLYALFLSLFDVRLTKIIILSLIILFINTGLFLLIGGCFLYDGMLLINIPYISLFVLIIPIYISLIYFVFNIIYRKVKYHNFIFNCKVNINDKTIKGKGYYDTGNALLHDDIPVIFTSMFPILNNGKIIKVTGINGIQYSYLAYKSKLLIKKKSIDVYLVFIGNKVNFYNCKFLLNKYVI